MDSSTSTFHSEPSTLSPSPFCSHTNPQDLKLCHRSRKHPTKVDSLQTELQGGGQVPSIS